MREVHFRGKDFLWVNDPSVKKEEIRNFQWNHEWEHLPPDNSPSVQKPSEIEQVPSEDFPKVKKTEYVAGDVCVPPLIKGVTFVPNKPIKMITTIPARGAYAVGDLVTYRLPTLTGSGPFTYQWFVNGIPRSTDAAFAYTVLNADLTGPIGPDGDRLWFFSVIITNACGTFNSVDYPYSVLPWPAGFVNP